MPGTTRKSDIESLKNNLNNNALEGRVGLVYARVSSKRQEIEGGGLESQEARCIKDLERLGIQYDRTFKDSFTGAGDFMRRPAMSAMLQYIDDNPRKHFLVIFDDLKRFDRDTEFHFKLKREFYRRGVILRCLNYNFDDSEMGQFMELVLVGYGTLERKLNQKQVVQRQGARFIQGYWAFRGKKGYDMLEVPGHPGKFSVPNREGLEMLKPALEGFANGTFIRKVDVCRYLLEKGFWKTQKAEKYITKITKIMKDPFYAGYLQYIKPPVWNIEMKEGRHQGIISKETFDLIQKRLRKVDLNKRVRLDISPEFPLRGLIIHNECKGHITASYYTNGKGKGYRKYVCHTKDCPSYNKAFRAEDAESRFEEILKKGALKEEVIELLKITFDRVWKDEMKQLQQKEQNSEQQKRAFEKKLAGLTDLMLSATSPIVKRHYEKQIEITAQQLETAEQESGPKLDISIPYQTALEKASLLLKKPDIAWEKLNIHEKHQLFFFLFQEKVTYSITEGYQTQEIPYAARLFEDFASETTQLVEMARVKLASKTHSSTHCSHV